MQCLVGSEICIRDWSVGVYSLVAMYSLEAHGIILGSIMSWVTAVAVWSMPSYIYLRWRTGVGDSRKVVS